MNRRDLLLQEMQIPQWVLRKPQALKGAAAVRLSENVKLVVISPQNYVDTPFFRDVLRTMQWNENAVQWFNEEQATRLEYHHRPIFWLIESEQADSLAQKFADCTLWQHTHWQDLSQSTHKRRLWQQIQAFLSQNEN